MVTGQTEVPVQIETSEKCFDNFCRGQSFAGDCGSPFEKPPWFDPERYERGRKVLWDNLFVALCCHLSGLIVGVSSFEPYKVLMNNGNHFSLRSLASRYISTAQQVISWYRSDIFDPTSEGYKSLKRVRAMHLAANRYMEKLEAIDDGKKWISQYWMGATQALFILLMVLHPKKLGLRHLNDKDLEGMLHYWRCIGYLLGISDEFNTCSGSLKDFRRFSELLIKREMHPSMQTASKGQLKLSQSIFEAFVTAGSGPHLLFTYSSFMTFFAKAYGLRYAGVLHRKDRFCLRIMTCLFEGHLLRFGLVRRLIRKRILYRLNMMTKVGASKLSNDLIDDLDSKDAPTCPFVALYKNSRS